MNRLTVLCSVAMVALILTGCERKGQSSAPYDPQKSPPPSAINVKEDPGLLADQSALSAAAERAKPATTAPAANTATPVAQATAAPAATTAAPVTASPTSPLARPAAPATSAPAATTATPVVKPAAPATGLPTAMPVAGEVATSPASSAETTAGKDNYQQLKTALESGKKEDILGKFADKDAALLAPIMAFDADSGKLVSDLMAAASKNDIQLTSRIMAGLPSTTEDSPLNKVRRMAPDNVKVSKQSSNLAVTDADNNIIVIYVKNGEKWQAAFTDKDQATLASLAPKCEAARKFAAAVLAGINDKSITKDNIADKLVELGKQ